MIQPVRAVAAGQFIVLIFAMSMTCTKMMQNWYNFNVPCFQTCFLFGTLGISLSLAKFLMKKHDAKYEILWERFEREEPYLTRVWKYILFAMVDVMANALLNAAFGRGDFLVVSFLQHMNIPFLTLLSALILGTRYRWNHYIGCVIAFVGCLVLLVEGIWRGSINLDWKSDAFLSCLYALLASLLFAVALVLQEYMVRDHGIIGNIEFMSQVGIYGFIIGCVSALVLEHNTLSSLIWSWKLFSILGVYAVVYSTFYFSVSVYIRWTSAVMFRLSMLTVDLWIALAAFAIFSDSIHTVYWCTVVIHLIGVSLYSYQEAGSSSKKIPETTHQVNTNNVTVIALDSASSKALPCKEMAPFNAYVVSPHPASMTTNTQE